MNTRLIVLLESTFVAVALFVPSVAGAFALVSGDILISNHTGNNVQRLDPVSSTVTTLVSTPSTPIGLAFDTSFNLFINTGNAIDKFDKNTNVLSTLFTGNGQREGLTFDPVTNNLFSVSFGANLIEQVDLAGNLVRTINIPGSTQLLGISARSGVLVVTDYGSGNVYLGTTTGSSFTTIGTVNPNNTYAPDIDAAGNIYVNNFGAGQVVKFTPAGGGTFTKSTFITGLQGPDNGLSIGDDGSFTISQFNANEISIYNINGTLRHDYLGVTSPDELVVFAPVRDNPHPAPEPGTLTLLVGAGLAFCWGVTRRS